VLLLCQATPNLKVNQNTLVQSDEQLVENYGHASGGDKDPGNKMEVMGALQPNTFLYEAAIGCSDD
jgi:hypothetical protein